MDIFVLDTSALVSDPFIYKKFKNSKVVIPVVVLSELDKLKKQVGETGKHARVAIRNLDTISNTGDISLGVLLDDEVFLSVDVNYCNLSNDYKNFGPLDYGDTQILVNAYELNQTGYNVTLVSRDINLRVKAKAFGVDAIDCEEVNGVSEMYTGHTVINDSEAGYLLKEGSCISAKEFDIDLNINQYALINDNYGKESICLAKKADEDDIIKIQSVKPWKVSSKNREQAFLIDLLLDNDIKLATVNGMAGTGKTFLTLACMLHLIIEKKMYNKCIIFRPIASVGAEIGYLPGSVDEKIEPYFKNIMDNFEALLGKNTQWKRDLEMWKSAEKISFEPITYIRGRSFSNTLIICDEAQNLSKEDIKTLLTRAGENTKVILTGDIYQIDTQTLDTEDNGLTYVIEKFKNKKIAGHVTLTKGERSELAEVAATIL